MKHLLLFLILTYSCACLSQRLYVIQDGSGNKNGDSWLNAMDDLSRAIEEASSGDTIFVGPGKFEGGFFFLTSSSCHPKFFVKEFCYFLMSCH